MENRRRVECESTVKVKVKDLLKHLQEKRCKRGRNGRF